MRVIANVLDGDDESAGVAIAGQAGVGKSRLAREAVAAAAGVGWAVRSVVGTVTSRAIPLGSFAQWTDGVDGNPLRLVRQVISTMTSVADDERVLVAVDDAHLLDNLSAFVLHQLVLQGAAAVVATIRSGEPAPGAVTALWKEGHLRRLELQPLSRPELVALLETALEGPISPDCADRMWRLTRGNVLFVRQLVEQEMNAGRLVNSDGRWQWSGRVAVSPSLIELVELQIGAVSEPVREVVDLVAVAEPLERAWLASLVDPHVIEQAERRGLIAGSAGTLAGLVQVAHPLYGEVRLEQTGPLRLSRLRGRIASAMASGNGSADPLRLGLLWLASDLEPDGDVLLRAAQAALMRLDLELTERLTEAAVRAGAGPEAGILRAHALILLNRGIEAEVTLDSLEKQLPEPLSSKVPLLRAANLLWPLGRPDDSWKVIDDALAGSAADRGNHLHAFRSVQLAMAARPTEVSALMETFDRSKLGVLPALLAIWAEVIALGDLGHPQRAGAAATEGYELAAGSIEAAYQRIGLTEFHVAALLVSGCIGQALLAAQHSYEKLVNLPGMARSVATGVSGMAALGEGDLTTALGYLRSAVADFDAHDDTTGILYRFMIVYSQALARAGDVDAALSALQRTQSIKHPSCVFVESDYLLSTAWVEAARGHVGQARENALHAACFAQCHHQSAREVMCLQAAVQFGVTKAASRLEELAAHIESPRAQLAARYARALTHDDADALCSVSRGFEGLGDRFAAADAAAQASLAYRKQGRRGAALSAGGRARRIMKACGDAISPAVRATQSALPLTAREHEIGTLVAQGLANREIARALTMSVRTVEGHIYRITSKLGVANRTELSALLREFDTVAVQSP